MIGDWVTAAAGIFIYRVVLWVWRHSKPTARRVATKLFAWRVVPAKRLKELEESEKALRVLVQQVHAIEEKRSASKAG